MASFYSNLKPGIHTRSISLPCTSDQQSVFNEFYRYQSSQEATTSCSSSSSLISQKLNHLNDMYESIQPFLTKPSTQKSLAHGCHKEQLNKFLDELVGLLDLCDNTKDALSISIDCSKELQSVIRRKRGINNHGLSSSVEEYLSHRRKVKKAVCKTLSGLQKHCCASVIEGQNTISDINILREMRLSTLGVFESLLTFILGSNTQSKPKAWSSLVKKMTGYKRVQSDPILEEGEVKKVDDELHALISIKETKSGSFMIDNIQKGLAEMEFGLLDLSEQVECLCRQLIKTRVSILNILNV